MRRALLGLALLFCWGALGGGPRPAAAHPLGNFTVNHYSRIVVSSDQVVLRYVLDLAEIPAYQEMQIIDRDGDGRIDDGERTVYLRSTTERILPNLRLAVDGAPLTPRLDAQELTFPAGQGNLPTIRLVSDFVAPLPALGRPADLSYRDDNDPGRLGWREIVIQSGTGVAIQRSSVAAVDQSAELTAYPEDLRVSPLDQRTAEATIARAATGAAAEPGVPAPVTAPGRASPLDRSVEGLTSLVTSPDLNPLMILLALAVAFGLGALHAFSPGHGKTIVGAYLVGSRGTARHAVFLGLTVTLTHTAGVFALGAVALAASRYILPEQLYPWLSLCSGLLVVAIGGSLCYRRRQSFRRRREIPGIAAVGAPATPPRASRSPSLVPPVAARLALATGGLGSATASLPLPRPNPTHHHDPGHERDHPPGHDDGHDHDHDHGGAHTHSHLPPGADGRQVTWRGLLALGISGGLLPCPSALVVLLSAISLHRVGFGLLLIVAFSAGLAGVLTAIGLLLVSARQLFARLPTRGPVVRLLPIGSAVMVTVLGFAIVAEAIGQLGVGRV